MDCGVDKALGVMNSEEARALGGHSATAPTASCPQYTGLVIFLLVLYGFWCSLIWTFRPTFTLKAGVARSDPNSVDLTSGFLYALLFTALVLLVVGLVVRCQRCKWN
jgi:hypothetical protein